MTDTTIDRPAPTKSEPFVRPDVRNFLDYLNSIPGPKMHQQTPTEARAVFYAMKDIADPPVGVLATIKDLTIPVEGGSIAARLFDPRETREPGPMVVFFHGGGFVLGDLDSHDAPCRYIADRARVRVLSVDYRLAPETMTPRPRPG